MNTRKKTAFGILGTAATVALVAGASVPAMADDHESNVSETKLIAKLLGDVGLSNESPVVVAPQVGTGDILSGNGNGNHVGSGNEIGSGNDTAIGSGNDTAIDGVDASDLVDSNVSDLVDSTVGDITGDLTTDVSDLLDSIDVSLDGMFED